MTVRERSHDVVIVGAGIAGAALATVLARAGRDVLVLEKSETYADRVRGEAILQWGVAEAKRLGLLDALIAAGGHFVGQALGYDEVLSVEAVESAPGDMSEPLPGIPGLLTLPHPAHCQALAEAAVAAGATLIRGVTIESARAGPTPQVVFEADGEPDTARARLVVGADGRPSAIREAFGLPVELTPPRGMMAGLLVEGVDGWDAGAWSLGTEGDLCFAVFPMGDGRARLYGFWSVDLRHRFAGAGATANFLAAFNLACCPNSDILAKARPAGPLLCFLNNETETPEPFVEGGVLVGDAAGWLDPIIGCGLSCAYRDARLVSEILLASDDWSPAAFKSYADERRERVRRLRAVGAIVTDLYCDFGDFGRNRRLRFFEQSQADPSLQAHIVANLAGPETQPDAVFTPDYRAAVLGSA